MVPEEKYPKIRPVTKEREREQIIIIIIDVAIPLNRNVTQNEA